MGIRGSIFPFPQDTIWFHDIFPRDFLVFTFDILVKNIYVFCCTVTANRSDRPPPPQVIICIGKRGKSELVDARCPSLDVRGRAKRKIHRLLVNADSVGRLIRVMKILMLLSAAAELDNLYVTSRAAAQTNFIESLSAMTLRAGWNARASWPGPEIHTRPFLLIGNRYKR